MERIALHTRLKPGGEQAYEEVHAVIPATSTPPSGRPA